jgi:hypothetical protein
MKGAVPNVIRNVIPSAARDLLRPSRTDASVRQGRARSLAPLGMTTLIMTTVISLLAARPAAAQHGGQIWEVVPDTARATVGDPVTIHFRLRLDDRDLLFDSVPRPADPLPEEVRLLSVEKLLRRPDRIFVGEARLAFYRPGRQPVPVFSLPFMRAVKGIEHGMVLSDSAFVEIAPVLDAGNPSLRDIRELARSPLPHLLWWSIAVGLAGAAVWLVWRLRRRARVVSPPVVAPEPAPPPMPDPYSVALAQLGEIERAGWPAQGRVAQHYQAVTDALRDYLEAAESLPARERTTSELLWALPPHLVERGLRRRCEDVLDQADLVKFARVRPGAADAAAFLQHARGLLTRWHDAASRAEALDAVR